MNKVIHFTIFILKISLFSIKKNPFIYILLSIVVFLWITKDITKHDILIAMYLSGFSAMCIGKILTEDSFTLGLQKKNTDVLSYFKLLPLSNKMLFQSVTIANLIYTLAIHCFFIFILSTLVIIPPLYVEFHDLINPRIVHQQEVGNHVVLFETHYYSPRGFLFKYVSDPLEPSLIFGNLKSSGVQYKKTNGNDREVFDKYEVKPRLKWPIFYGWHILLLLLFFFPTFFLLYNNDLNILNAKTNTIKVFNTIGIIIYLLVGLLILIDILLPHKIIWKMRAYIDNNQIYLYCFLGIVIIIYPLLMIIQHCIIKKMHPKCYENHKNYYKCISTRLFT